MQGHVCAVGGRGEGEGRGKRGRGEGRGGERAGLERQERRKDWREGRKGRGRGQGWGEGGGTEGWVRDQILLLVFCK